MPTTRVSLPCYAEYGSASMHERPSSEKSMKDRHDDFVQVLIHHSEGICGSCLVTRTGKTLKEIQIAIKDIAQVAPVAERPGVCGLCGRNSTLYSIHYPLP